MLAVSYTHLDVYKRQLFDHPMHPYTLVLLKSIPRLEDDDSKRLYMICLLYTSRCV